MRRLVWMVAAVVGVVAIMFATTVIAQDMVSDGEGGFVAKPQAVPPDQVNQLAPEGFGSQRSILQIPASSFVSRFVGDELDYYASGYMDNPNAVAGFYQASVNLPAGAAVDWVDLYSYDVDATNDVTAWLRCYYGGDYAGTPPDYYDVGSVSSTGSDGYVYYANWVIPAHTINNNVAYEGGCQYQVVVKLFQGHAFKGVDLWWRRQVSPAPASATFGDVGTGYWAFPFIEALAASGITAGCGGGNFCPDATLTRAQMAVFLSGALGLNWFDYGN